MENWIGYRKNLVDVAMGRKPADIVIRNGQWVNVQSGEILPGYSIAISPLALMASAMQAMKQTLDDLKRGIDPDPRMMPFDELRRVIGFDDYYEAEKRYASSAR